MILSWGRTCWQLQSPWGLLVRRYGAEQGSSCCIATDQQKTGPSCHKHHIAVTAEEQLKWFSAAAEARLNLEDLGPAFEVKAVLQMPLFSHPEDQATLHDPAAGSGFLPCPCCHTRCWPMGTMMTCRVSCRLIQLCCTWASQTCCRHTLSGGGWKVQQGD